MLIMSGVGAAVSPFLPNWTNVVMGLFVFYLTATAWMTVRRPAGEIGWFEVGWIGFAWAVAAFGVLLGLRAAASPGGQLAGDPPFAFFALASLPGLAGAMDLGMLRRGGVSGPQRIARHLWRMCIALFIATASLFLGQPKVFPSALRGSPIMFAPEIVIMGLLLFWLYRNRQTTARTKVLVDFRRTARAGS